MTEPSLRNVILLALREREGNRADARGASIRGLADEIDLETTVVDRFRLASTLSALEADGLVAEREMSNGDARSYVLTDEGLERATACYERLATKTVVVVDGDDRRELELGSVPDDYDRSLAAALSLRAPDGAIYLEPAPDPGFVDRDEQRQQLCKLLEESADRGLETALVSGDPGIGKTTLLERVLETAADSGYATAIGRCRRDGGAPYHPFRDIVDAIGNAAATAVAGDPFAGVEPPSVSPDEASYRALLGMFHDRIADWLEERAADVGGPLVLVIEDLQWADTATLGLLEHLLEAETDESIVLIGTCRATALDEGAVGASDRSPLEACLTSDEWSLRLELDPFDQDAVTELVERHVGRRGVPDEFVNAITEQTGGNPLFVAETVEEMVADGTIDPTHGRYPDRPEDVIVTEVIETAVENRLSRLEGDARAVLEAGAVVDDVVPIALLRAVTDHGESTLEGIVDSLVETRLWQRVDDGTVRFTSDVVRSVVRAEIDDGRLRRLHRWIAEAMADDDGRYAHGTIAHHFERGGEPDRALEGWIAAGDEATTVYAHDAAIERFDRALRLAREYDRNEIVLEVLESLGDVYATRGEYELADKHFRYVRERTDDPERTRRTYRYQARIRLERGEFEQTAEYAAAGLDVADNTDVTEELCWLHDYHANADMKRGNLEAAIEEFTVQREQAERLDHDFLLGRAHNNLGICATIGGDGEEGIERMERAVSLIESVGDERELANCLNNLAIAYHDANRFQRAEESFERALELATKTGRPKTVALAANNLSVTARLQGRWDQAREYAEEASETGSRIQSDEMTGAAVSNRAMIEAETGSLETAIETSERSVEITSRIESPTQLARDRWALGRFLLRAGDLERAAEEIDASLELATDYGLADQRALALRARGRLQRERGDLEAALEDHNASLELACEVGSDVLVARSRIEYAATLSRADRIDRALEVSRAARDAVPPGFRLLELKAAAVHGGALRRAGEYEAAETILTETLAAAPDVSKIATLRCLSELGALALETGDLEAARDRLIEGRDRAVESGETLYRERFDALLESCEMPSDEPPETLLETDRSATGNDSDGHGGGSETGGAD